MCLLVTFLAHKFLISASMGVNKNHTRVVPLQERNQQWGGVTQPRRVHHPQHDHFPIPALCVLFLLVPQQFASDYNVKLLMIKVILYLFKKVLL